VSPDQLCPQSTPEDATDVLFAKRIVAGPGDTIAIRRGHVILNGKLQAEPFARRCSGGGCTFTRPIKIAAGYWFVLGDNRGVSDDSRFWGPVPTAWIVAKVLAK
jgi:signal peptidase I